MVKLSKEEIDLYREKGFVVPNFKVSDEIIRRLREALDDTLRDNPHVRPEQLASIHTSKSSATDTIGHKTFLDVALDNELVDPVSSILGDHIVMWGVQLFCKPGDDGMEVPMHQDGQYWPIRPLATCTLWLAIDDSDRGNGCLKVVPGSHKSLFLHLRVHSSQTGEGNMRVNGATLEGAIEVHLKAGDAVRWLLQVHRDVCCTM